MSVARRAGRPSGPLAVCAAVLGLLEAVGEREGLLVVVDDLQWVDQPSTEVLLFVARRLQSPRVSLVFATREERRVVPGALVVDVGRLSGTESRELLRRLTGELAPVAVDRLVIGLAGHPLALVENARHLGPAIPPRGRAGPRGLWTAALEALPESSRTAVTVLAAAGSRGRRTRSTSSSPTSASRPRPAARRGGRPAPGARGTRTCATRCSARSSSPPTRPSRAASTRPSPRAPPASGVRGT